MAELECYQALPVSRLRFDDRLSARYRRSHCGVE